LEFYFRFQLKPHHRNVHVILHQDTVQITANWSRSKPEVELQYGARLYLKNGSSYISAVNWDYVDEIWSHDRLWSSENSDINKYETGSSI